ncbi:hypothetical protein BJ170DRAFT_602917 [Xylariales sp. AK1849]|nr:hypothetical protein BJ170DRAFT_602917 [Xylariales sp. AK1849]
MQNTTGGISFFSNRYGWACDNLVNYEVVIASGRIINANKTSHSDLYWALRGGGNNFGVVTRFDASAYPQSLMWGGDRVYPIAANTSLIEPFVHFGKDGVLEDKDAAAILSFAYDAASGSWLTVTSLEHTMPQPSGQHPVVFDGFFGVPGAVFDGTATKSQSNITLEFDAAGPNGFRETFWTLSFILDEGIISNILQIWFEETEPLTRLGFTTFLPALAFQAITLPQIAHMSQEGGNALGLSGSGAPLLISHWTFMWDDEQQDAAVLDAYSRILTRAKAVGEELGVGHRYIYQNYASQFQDPIRGYGLESRERLIDVSRKYDPTGVFQYLQPGYFKLDRDHPQ